MIRRVVPAVNRLQLPEPVTIMLLSPMGIPPQRLTHHSYFSPRGRRINYGRAAAATHPGERGAAAALAAQRRRSSVIDTSRDDPGPAVGRRTGKRLPELGTAGTEADKRSHSSERSSFRYEPTVIYTRKTARGKRHCWELACTNWTQLAVDTGRSTEV